VQSLHYFLPVIEELMAEPLSSDYIRYLTDKLTPLRKDAAESDDQRHQWHRSAEQPAP